MAQDFNNDERQRYARHFALAEVGVEGQRRLRNGSVLVVGAGGLGSPVLLYLAAAGVGHIGVIDGDRLDYSNLQRQVIHTTTALGEPKAVSAAQAIHALNPNIRVTPYVEFLSAENADEILRGYEFVVDATDNLRSKFLINDLCVKARKPFSHGAISRFAGHTMTVLPGTACYRCLIPEAEQPAESPAGPLGAIPGIIGSMQAVEAIKYLTGVGRLLTNRILTFDALTMTSHVINVPLNHNCPMHNA
ncbi:MAG: HesA/MoeB/ThiF family protein [Muribaculaceae bacterium]